MPANATSGYGPLGGKLALLLDARRLMFVDEECVSTAVSVYLAPRYIVPAPKAPVVDSAEVAELFSSVRSIQNLVSELPRRPSLSKKSPTN